MNLYDAFKVQFEKSESIINRNKKDDVFNAINLTFFAIVNPKITYIGKTKDIKSLTKIENDELKLGIGKFVIKDYNESFIKDITQSYTLTIEPLDYKTFIMDKSYLGDYITLCGLIIEEWNIRIIGYVKTLGIEAVEGQQGLTKDEFVKQLKRNYAITIPETITF